MPASKSYVCICDWCQSFHHVLQDITHGPNSPKTQLGIVWCQGKEKAEKVSDQTNTETICYSNCPLSDDNSLYRPQSTAQQNPLI